MPESVSVEPPRRGTRPANRRELIAAAAAELFYRHGYAKVGMNDIAEAVAISRPALYRHFAGKQDLLTEVVRQAIERTAAVLTSADSADLDSVLRAVARDVLDHREAGVLWQRDGRHLPPEQRAVLREKTREIGDLITHLLLARRPDLDQAGATLLAWCGLAVATSVSFHDLELPREELEGLLAKLVGRVVRARLPQTSAVPAEVPHSGLASQSRWEELLETASQLFATHGYTAVGMDDIAAKVGIAGPSIYHHFAGKADILVAAMNRGAEWLRYDMRRALAASEDHADGLRRLLRAYTTLVLENNHLVDLLINESLQLPAEARAQVRRAARDYIGDWTHLLRTVHSGLEDVPAQIEVQAVLSMVNTIARSSRLRRLPGVAESLQSIGAAVLDLP